MPKPPRRVQFALAERLEQLDADTWSTLTAKASVFLQRPFLTALERACPDNLSPRYALMSRDGQPLAALVLQLVRLRGSHAVASTSALGSMAQLVDERALVLGNLAAWGETGLVLAPGADPALVWAEALTLVDRLRRFEKLEGAVNVSFVKDAAQVEEEPALRKLGYQRAPSGPDMQLVVEPSWGDLEGYLASLAAKRRRAVRKTFEELEAKGYGARQLSLEELRANAPRLEALYGQVWANAEVRPVKLSGDFFVELKAQLGEDCAVLGLEREGQLDAFGVCLRSQDTCVGYYLGFDKAVEAPLYLRLLVGILEQALAWRSARASLGRTAEEPKARLGAVPVAPQLWVKHRAPPLNWAVGAILGALEAPEVPTHRVFRADA